MEESFLFLALVLGMRHGMDADHLAAIDGLARVHPGPWNGLLFALGHGAVVTLLAVGVGGAVAAVAGGWSPWLLIALGALNLWRLANPHPVPVPRLVATGPLLLGVLLAAGFETASQLSALALSNRADPWLLGTAFSLGMILVDGTDGYLASRVQRASAAGGRRTRIASRALGVAVVVFSFGLGGAQLLGFDFEPYSLAAGGGLFALLVALRLWSVEKPALGESK
ncbi:hypothetical protein [Gloeobacter morelensis]|uniref:Nickel/cobalt efflux system n=1 Tax=Gloeobacter morelensis MG652769 TaxID=2781736 RepID=A0ABY3PI67_9CYAN|nr:hypothetical protein [Gloeobacter morelensis]UFP93375.1 hypothetical protein ISF26_16435 [Gloeobacter morelensis MG652769]